MLHKTTNKEIAILVLVIENTEEWPFEQLAEEFRSLVISTGLEVEDIIRVKLRIPNPAFFIGKGKVQELKEFVLASQANVVIFNSNLNYTQQKNLEEVFGIKTVDRTQLILDIFAKHAHSSEGILQVELAQLNYMLPRLRGKGIMLSRLGGGIGTLGPGEKKLEVDRRVISDRITRLNKELEQIKLHRGVMRKKREKEGVHICSLVGYTNAGKTTLFNSLTESDQIESSEMFTTLGTVTRSLSIHKNIKAILADTVGFIYKLPINLVQSFKATLEELQFADILLHVIDVSNENFFKLKKSVELILHDIGVESKPTINVFNQIDKLSEQDINAFRKDYPEAIFVSAYKKTGIEELKLLIHNTLNADMLDVIVRLGFNQMGLTNYLHKNCEILKTTYQENESVYWIKIKKAKLEYLKKKGISIKVL